jgi:hypothetical protein
MEDFWSRRINAPIYERTIRVLGRTVIFRSNHQGVLESANIAERIYSSAVWTEEAPWQVDLIVHDARRAAGSPPERLIDLVHYAGDGDWLSIDLGVWGNCFADMERGEAHAVLSSSLAARPDLVSQVLVNTILTNCITRHGYGMLHASALVKDSRILLLMAPHSTGKSTTALRLLLNGYKLLSDSMVYVGEHAGALWMGGFPVGRIKLRKDMLAHFPALAANAQVEPVRDETKHRLELDRLDPERTCRDMVRVDEVEFCLLERWAESDTHVEPLGPDELWPEIMLNSLHYDTLELWQENLHKIGLLLEHAQLHRLRIGTSESRIIRTIDQLWMPHN